VRQQAHITGASRELRAAPRPPGALRALANPDRNHHQRGLGIGLVPGGDGEDVKAEAELEVVHLHGRAPPLPVTRRRGQPGRGVQVIPGDDAVDADDAAHAARRRSHARGFEHALVVGQLEEVVLAFAGRRARIYLGGLPDQPLQ
jgi:hypothetical protein